MRRIINWILIIALVLGLCACGQSTETTWKEQHDLGVRYLSEGNYEEAIIAFTAAIEIDPKHPESYVGRGRAYLKIGETEENINNALTDYQAAVELDKTLIDVWLGIVEILIKLGDYDQAVEILEGAIEKVDDPESLQNRLDELLKEIDASANPLLSDPNVWVDEMEAILYLTEDAYHIDRMTGAGINDFQVYISFSKDAPVETGYIQFSGSWADGVDRYVDWGRTSSLEAAERSAEGTLSSDSMDFLKNNYTLSARFDVGLALNYDELDQMPYLYLTGIDANGNVDSSLLLTLDITPGIMEKIEAVREYAFG